MYIAPRLHPNQCPILSGWIDSGNNVCFLAQHEGHIEDHSVIQPIILGKSDKCEKVLKYIHIVSDGDLQHEAYIRSKLFWPPLKKYKFILKEFKPDLIVMRDRSLYVLVCYWIAYLCKIPVVLYTQSPLYSEKKRSIKRIIGDVFFPKYQMTPVWQRGNYYSRDKWTEKGYREPNSFFVPFVMQPHCPPQCRKYFMGNRINLLDVGRYEKRKNHLALILTLKKIIKEYPQLEIHLRIVGECANAQQRMHKTELAKIISENELERYVDLLENLNAKQMQQEYMKADLFVLPSSGEPAAISPLEAMSYSIACISGDDNGTADYIIPGKTGDVFHDCNWDELYKKMSTLILNREKLVEAGEAAYWHIKENYSFEKYQEKILGILQRCKKK